MIAPQCKKELKSFQSIVNYLKCSSNQLTQLAESLKELLRHETLWNWETKHQNIFETKKYELTKTSVFVYFYPKADHIIQVVESMKGLTALLLQKGRPVIYVSTTLILAETGKINIESELPSVVFDLERLHHYVLGSKI